MVGAAEGRLSAAEDRRRFLHMTPGLLPLFLIVIPHQDPWGAILVNIVIGLFVTIVVAALSRYQQFARPGECDGRASVLGYALPILAALSLFRGREEIGLMTLIILAFGDGSATLSGLWFGGQPLPWNPRKSWTGTLSFVGCATPLATLVYWSEARPTVPLATVAAIAACTTLVCAIVESLPSRWNDNLRVGATAAIMGAAMTAIMVG